LVTTLDSRDTLTDSSVEQPGYALNAIRLNMTGTADLRMDFMRDMDMVRLLKGGSKQLPGQTSLPRLSALRCEQN
jgi:hypothetical protein